MGNSNKKPLNQLHPQKSPRNTGKSPRNAGKSPRNAEKSPRNAEKSPKTGFFFAKNPKKSPVSQLPQRNSHKLQPKPVKSVVNPENFSKFAAIPEEIARKPPETLRILTLMPPLSSFHGHTVKKLRNCKENQAIYSVFSKENREKLLLVQEKFSFHHELNEKLRVLSRICAISSGKFREIADFFVEVEEIDGFAFFYLNILQKPKKTRTFSQILDIFKQKPAKPMEEELVWQFCRVFLRETRELFEEMLFLSDLRLENLGFFVEKSSKRQETPASMSRNIISLLGKALKTRAEVLFFNKIARNSKKTRTFGRKSARKLAFSGKMCFEPTNFRTFQAEVPELCLETAVFASAAAFFLEVLAFLSKSAPNEIFKAEVALSAIESLEYSASLKEFLRKTCVFRLELPRSLDKVHELLDFYHKSLEITSTVEKSQGKTLEIREKVAQKLRISAFAWLFHVFEEFLLLVSLKNSAPKAIALNFSALTRKHSEIARNPLKICVWSSIREHFFVAFARKQGFCERIYRLSVDFVDIQSKAEESSAQSLVFLDISSEDAYKLEEIFEFSAHAGFEAKEMSAERAETLEIMGTDAILNKIRVFSLDLKEKRLILLQEFRENPQILDFWLRNREIWLWVRADTSCEAFQVLDTERNREFRFEIDGKSREMLGKLVESADFALEFLGRPLVLSQEVLALAEVRLCNGISKEITLCAKFNENFREFHENQQDFRRFFEKSLRNHAIVEQTLVFSTSVNEKREFSLDFYEFDAELRTFSLENSKKLGKVSENPSFALENAEIVRFSEDFALSRHKCVETRGFAESFEAFDEFSGRTFKIYKQLREMRFSKQDSSRLKAVFFEAKLFFSMIWPFHARKSLHLPENFYVSVDVARHCLELWLFVEKTAAKNLWQFLLSRENAQTHENLRLCREIVKTFAKVQAFQQDFHELLRLDRIFPVFDAQKRAFLVKFAAISQENRRKIREIFELCEDFHAEAELVDKRLQKLNEMLESQTSATKSLAIVLFLTYFPEFLRTFQGEFAEIAQFLNKTRRKPKFFDERAVQLFEDLLLRPGKAPDLREIAGILLEIAKNSQRNVISCVYKGRNLFENIEKTPLFAQTLVFVEEDCPWILQYRASSQEIRKFPIISRKTRQKLDCAQLLAFTSVAESAGKLKLFAFVRENHGDSLRFAEISEANGGELALYADFFEPTPGIFEDLRDLCPTGLYFFKGFVYQIGGKRDFFKQSRGSREVFRFEVQRRTWQRCQSLTFARENAGITSSGDFLYVFGEFVQENETFARKNAEDSGEFCVERLDFATNCWETIVFKGLSREILDVLGRNTRLLQRLDAEGTFFLVNLRRSRALVLKTRGNAEVFEAEVGKSHEFARFCAEKAANFEQNRWICERIVVGKSRANAVFCDKGWLFCVNLRESAQSFEISWETEFCAWEYA